MKVKQIPEDFIVEEVIELKTEDKICDYSIWKLTKKEWESFKIIEALARALRSKTKFIGFAGNKDRVAVTTQYISIYKINKEVIDRIKVNNTKLEFIGYSRNRINLGDLKGNNFTIVIRDLKKEVKLPKDLQLENYFDEQRFGNKMNTHLVGKSILKRNFRETCKLLKLSFKDADYIGAIRKQQRRLLRFYISSYQSYIWNKTLKEILKKENNTKIFKSKFENLVFTKNKIKNFTIPIVNFDIEDNKIINKILKEEEVSKEDFIIKEMPELITESVHRGAFIEVKDIKYKYSKDELNKGKLKLELQFFLPKGSYATMLIKKLSIFLNN